MDKTGDTVVVDDPGVPRAAGDVLVGAGVCADAGDPGVVLADVDDLGKGKEGDDA